MRRVLCAALIIASLAPTMPHRRQPEIRPAVIRTRKPQEKPLFPLLIKAIIQVESRGRPQAVSRKGAQGLMQLMPAMSRKMGVKNPLDPEENVRGGTKLLSEELKRFDGSVPLALAAYNAGSPRVRKAIDKAGSKNFWSVVWHLPDETKRYVPKVFVELAKLHSEKGMRDEVRPSV